MMELEKKLAKINLSNLKEQYNLKQLQTLATNIVKYQLFKADSAIKHLDSPFTLSTTKSYFNVGIRYINSGVRKSNANAKLFDLIDDALKQHIQPLQPSEQDRRITRKPYKRRHKVEVVGQTPLQEIASKTLTEKFEYGVKRSNTIILMPSEQAADAFIYASRALGNATFDIKKVLITIEEVEYV